MTTWMDRDRGRDLFARRLRDATLSRWELGDLLGIHPHDLRDVYAMLDQPVRVLIDLARRLDLHPVDIVPELGPTRPADEAGPAHTQDGDGDQALDADAFTVLAVLVTTSVPLTADQLATVLDWTLDRVHAALDHADAHPRIGGPVALRRVPPQTWTVTPRYDVLTEHQRRNLTDLVHHAAPLAYDGPGLAGRGYRCCRRRCGRGRGRRWPARNR
jgi:hypothetical protein